MGTLKWPHLDEVILMNIHNICFYGGDSNEYPCICFYGEISKTNP